MAIFAFKAWALDSTAEPLRVSLPSSLNAGARCDYLGPSGWSEQAAKKFARGLERGEPMLVAFSYENLPDVSDQLSAIAAALERVQAELGRARSAADRKLGEQLVRVLQAQLAAEPDEWSRLMEELKASWTPRDRHSELLASYVMADGRLRSWAPEDDAFVQQMLRSKNGELKRMASAELLCAGQGPPEVLSGVEAKRREGLPNLVVTLAYLWAEEGQMGGVEREFRRYDPLLASLDEHPMCQPLAPDEVQGILARAGAEPGTEVVQPLHYCRGVLDRAVALASRLPDEEEFEFAPAWYRAWYGALESCSASCGTVWGTWTGQQWTWSVPSEPLLQSCLTERLADRPSPPQGTAVGFRVPCQSAPAAEN